jgi:hypothetical protein
MLPGSWAGTIFSGLGLRGLGRGGRCEAPGFVFPIELKVKTDLDLRQFTDAFASVGVALESLLPR